MSTQDFADISSQGSFTATEVESQLQKILLSTVFSGSQRDSTFLEFIVRKALAGEVDNLKEYLIGLEVFGRKTDFDPGSDPVVRSQARRLRTRLEKYYATIGRADPIHIGIPKGTYVPTFHANGIGLKAEESEALEPKPVEAVDRGALSGEQTARRSRWILWLLVGATITGLAVYAVYRYRVAPRRAASQAATITGRRSVAVIGFASLSPQSNATWLSTALAETLTAELGAGGKLLTVPRETVVRGKTELGLVDENGFSTDTLNKLRRNLNAEIVISGAYLVAPSAAEGSSGRSDDQIRLYVRAQNASTGETLDTISEAGTTDGIPAMAAEAGQKIRQSLGIEPLAATQIDQARLLASSSPQALELYSKGIEKLRHFDPLAARDSLERATEADPNYALAHSALAEAWLLLGYDAKAEQAARRAHDLSGNLELEQKFLIEGRYYETAHQWEQAIAAYNTLYSHYPDNIEYGIRLARAQQQAAKYQDVLNTVQALRKLPQPQADDPRLALAEANAYWGLGDTNRYRTAVQAAEESAVRRGELVALAQAQLLHGSWQFGQEESEPKIKSALDICQKLGDIDCVARAHWRLGMTHDSYSAEAAAQYQEAINGFRAVRDLRGLADAERAMGNMYLLGGGNPEQAKRYYAETLATCKIIQDRACIWKQTLNEGSVSFVTGALPEAEAAYRQALVLAQQTADAGGIALCMSNLGESLHLQGKLDEALSFFQQAATLTQPRGDKFYGWALANIGAVQLDQAKLSEARKSLQAAMATSKDEFPPVGDSIKTLAVLDMVEGKPEVAEKDLRRAAEYMESQKENEEATAYYDYLSLALLAQKKSGEALKTVERAHSLLPKETTGPVPIHLEITEALVNAAARPQDQKTINDALAGARSVAAKCRKRHLVGLEFQARLAEGTIEMESGRSSEARTVLASLEADARARGFELMARQPSQISHSKR